MKTAPLSLMLLSLCFVNQARAQSATPKFRDYPVSEVYTGKTAPLILKKSDRTFKTRLHEAAKNERPNFAGRYIMTFWGCGTSCVMGAVIDAKTGSVHWWNFTICCWRNDVDDKFEPIEVRPNSRLIVFSGARNEKDGDAGTHFYKIENGRFIHLKSILDPKQEN